MGYIAIGEGGEYADFYPSEAEYRAAMALHQEQERMNKRRAKGFVLSELAGFIGTDGNEFWDGLQELMGLYALDARARARVAEALDELTAELRRRGTRMGGGLE